MKVRKKLFAAGDGVRRYDLEAESMRRGMTNVRCNRIVAVAKEEGRKNAPLETMSNKITEGTSNGLALIYARGPEVKRSNLFRHWVPSSKSSTGL